MVCKGQASSVTCVGTAATLSRRSGEANAVDLQYASTTQPRSSCGPTCALGCQVMTIPQDANAACHQATATLKGSFPGDMEGVLAQQRDPELQH